MAGAPYPVLVPQWQMVVKPDTVRGVQSYRTGLILDIIFGFFALLISISGFLLFGSSGDFTGVIAAGAILGAASCGLVIVFIINFIVSLMSVMRMSHGVDEYGPEHARHARRGILFKWLGTTFSISAAILVVWVLIAGTSYFLPGTRQTVPIEVYIPLMITIFWTGGVACKGQMYRNLVRVLQPPDTVKVSSLASLLIPALGLVGIAIVGFVTARVLSYFSGAPGLDFVEAGRLSQLMISGVFLPPGLAVIGYFMFFWVYGKTYRRLNDSLARSPAPLMYVPVAPVMSGMPWPGMTPGYAPPVPATPPVAQGQPATATVQPTSQDPQKSPEVGNRTCPRCATPQVFGARFCSTCAFQLLP